MREWPWLEMVGQLDRASIAFVVNNGDRSRGFVDCEINAAEHVWPREVPKRGPFFLCDKSVWVFFLIRGDQSAVRLRPH